jgi:hypothetical protein
MSRIVRTVSLLALTAGLIACSGTTPTSTPGGATTAPGGESAPASMAPGTAAAPTASAGASLPDIANAGAALSGLTSYQVDLNTTSGSDTTQVTAIVVHQPVSATQITAVDNGDTTRIIVIGQDAWADEGTGTYVKLPDASMIAAFTQAFDPSIPLHGLQSTGYLPVLQNEGLETKNGVQALHLHIDSSTPLPAGASPLPAGAVGDVWVSPDGYLVALEATDLEGSGTSTYMYEVSHINDPSLSVSPPS